MNILLLPHQSSFIQAPFLHPESRFHFLVAGYGAGKTSSLAYAWLYLVNKLQGMTSREGHGPRILLGGVTLAHLEKTTLSYIKEKLEWAHTPFIHDKKNNRLVVGNVTTIMVSLSNPSTIVGFDCCASIMDELDDLSRVSAAADVTFEAFRAVNERTRQIIPGFRSPFIISATTSQGALGLYRIYTSLIKAGTAFTLIRGRTKDNWYLHPDFVKSLEDVYSKKERKVYLEGEFIALSTGKVFGDFDWDRNFSNVSLDKEIAPHEVVYWAQDFNNGYHRGCAGVLRGGIIYIVKRYEFPDIREAPRVLRYDFPKNKIVWLPDMTAKDQILQFTKELHKHGIWWVTRGKNVSVEDSAFLCNKLLYTGRLIFTEAAKESAEAASLAVRDKNGMIPKGIGPTSPIHDTDTIRMLCYFVCTTQASMLDIRKAVLYRQQILEDEEPAVEELQDGYASINPKAL